MPSDWTTLDVDGAPMESYLAVPDGTGPFPGVVVGMHTYGVDRGVRQFCDDLAREGFAAIAPYLYHRNTDLTVHEYSAIPFEDPRRREEAAVRGRATSLNDLRQDVLAAVAYLRDLPQVGASPVGITGFCLGGRLSLYMAGASDTFAASAIFYGTDMNRARGGDPSPLSFAANIRCALAGFFGSEDQNPSPADVDEVDAELDRLGIPHTFHRFEGTPHAFNDPYNPVRWTPEPAAEAWRLLIEFFRGALTVGEHAQQTTA